MRTDDLIAELAGGGRRAGASVPWLMTLAVAVAIADPRNNRTQLELRHRPVDALASPRAMEAIGAGEEVEVLRDRELAVERELLRHVADRLPCMRRAAAQVRASHRE